MLHPSFKLLGRMVRDKVTKIEGICDSICFDLYGCIQASVRPEGLSDKDEPKLACWYDVKRLEAIGDPIMEIPDFAKPEIGNAMKAPR